MQFSHKEFNFGGTHNTTFYVYLYDFRAPFLLQVNQLQMLSPSNFVYVQRVGKKKLCVTFCEDVVPVSLPLTSNRPHLNSDVGLEEGEYLY